MSIRKLALDFDTTQWMAGRLNAQNAEQPELARADLVEQFQQIKERFPLLRPKLYLPYSELQAIAAL